MDLMGVVATYPIIGTQFPMRVAQVPILLHLQKKQDLGLTYRTLTPVCKRIFGFFVANTTGTLREFTLSYQFNPTMASLPTGIELRQKLRFSFFADDGSFFFIDIPAPKSSLFTNSVKREIDLEATNAKLVTFVEFVTSFCESPSGSGIKWSRIQLTTGRFVKKTT